MSRALEKHFKVSVATSIVFLFAFCAFLLVALSLPIIKPIWLYTIRADPTTGQPMTSVATDIKFGVWGFCTHSLLDGTDSYGTCFGPEIGFAGISLLDPQIMNSNKLVSTGVKLITIFLLLHPICALFSLATSFTSLFLESWKMRITTVTTGAFTCFFVSIVTAFDLTLISLAKKEMATVRNIMIGIGSSGFNVTVEWGVGPWLMVGGVGLSYVGLLMLIIVFVKERRERRQYKHLRTDSEIELMDTWYKVGRPYPG